MSVPTHRRRMEILVIEDNLEDAGATLQALRDEHIACRVNLVRDGEEAMRFLNREGIFARTPRPDLILLDLGLPKKDGRQVLSEIRQSEELRDVPVVVLTASTMMRVVLEAQQLRVDGYMTKPVSVQSFIDVVKSLRQAWLNESLLNVAT